jgi:hypothetical protein
MLTENKLDFSSPRGYRKLSSHEDFAMEPGDYSQNRQTTACPQRHARSPYA